MSIQSLEKLSNANGIVSNEQGARDVLVTELKEYTDEVSTDHLDSIIFEKGNKGSKIMLCAHIDEAGLIVRSISDIGQVMLMNVDGIKPLAQFIQKVCIMTGDGKKTRGIIQATYENNTVTKVYMGLGAQTVQEVYDPDTQVGGIVTYTTESEYLALADVVVGKALDDHLDCSTMEEALEQLQGIDHPNIVYMVDTSSEEVGIRGIRTAVYRVNPNMVLPIDVVCFNDEFVRNHTNQRQIGKGMMLTNFDRTLIPGRALIRCIKDTANTLRKSLQLDMFSGGGTGGGEAHKSKDGKLAAVSCLSVHYRHLSFIYTSEPTRP